MNPVNTSDREPLGAYSPINWAEGFERWTLVRFSTPADGSCLFHAICNSFFKPYREGIIEDKPVERTKITSSLRTELSKKLESKTNPEDDESPIYYDVLNKGNMREFSKSVPEFSLESMMSSLDSSSSLGYGYMEFIGDALEKDIYILEASRRDIYITDELPLTIKGNRDSLVLYYSSGHYELVGIKEETGKIITHFSCNHRFIKFLHARVTSITGK